MSYILEIIRISVFVLYQCLCYIKKLSVKSSHKNYYFLNEDKS